MKIEKINIYAPAMRSQSEIKTDYIFYIRENRINNAYKSRYMNLQETKSILKRLMELIIEISR